MLGLWPRIHARTLKSGNPGILDTEIWKSWNPGKLLITVDARSEILAKAFWGEIVPGSIQSMCTPL